MNAVDIIVLIVIAFNGLLGAIRGAAWQIFRIGGIALGVWAAARYGDDFLDMWPSSLELSETWGLVVSWVVVFMSVYLVAFGLTQLVKSLIEKIRLGSFDRGLGAGLGVLKGAAFCALAFYIILLLPRLVVPSLILDQLDGNAAKNIEPSVAHDLFRDYVRSRIDETMPDGWQDEIQRVRDDMEDEVRGK